MVTTFRKTVILASISVVIFSLQAFKSSEYKHGVDKSLPGLTLNPDQLFFIGFAQVCSTSIYVKINLLVLE